jgi:CheY-like chemotaxis protein
MARAVTRAPILIVEDNTETRVVLERVLQIRGYDVVTARDGLEAISYLQSGAQVAAIILDVAMPVMDGIELSEHLRTTPEWAHIPVIIYTAMDMKPVPSAAGIIRKGTDDPDRLLAMLARVTKPQRR